MVTDSKVLSGIAGSESTAPASGTLEAWAYAYLTTTDLEAKFNLGRPPDSMELGPPSRANARPGRPAELIAAQSRRKTPGREALRTAARRAELVHTFLHHELQAAELFCWAILAYPEAPTPFRRGLAAIARDEVRHMTMYQGYLGRLGYTFGDWPVRDWFWERVPAAQTPVAFVATLGIGFEGGNLDHTKRFAGRLRDIGDKKGAELEEVIFEEEIAHVRFAQNWFRRWTGASEFGVWARHLPPPLSPMLMKGDPMEWTGRMRSGLSEQFVAHLAAWPTRLDGTADKAGPSDEIDPPR
jgi:uncharacterized ferritin-like protein (DUF455 family)